MFTSKMLYMKNRKNCGAELKGDSAIEFIQYTEKKILEDKGYQRQPEAMRNVIICLTVI